MAVDVEQAFRAQLQGRLAAAKAPPHLVAVLYIRREPVLIFRFAWAEELGYVLTPFEEARLLEEGEGFTAAEGAFDAAGALDDRGLVFAHVRALIHGGQWIDAPAAVRAARARCPRDGEIERLAADIEHLVPNDVGALTSRATSDGK
jgi:hypothetical protein